MQLIAARASVTGPAHLAANHPNQDATMLSGLNGGYCVAVCDGLGSRKLSHEGSLLATRLVRSVLTNRDSRDTYLACQSIQKKWLKSFSGPHREYETTCLWAVVDKDGHASAAQAGDGLLLIKSQGKFLVMTPEEPGFGNQTHTLAEGSNELWTTANFALTEPGDGVLLMSDGISDDLVSEQLEDFFDAIYYQRKRTNKRRCKQWLTHELINWSTPMHGDDKSIAAIFRVK